MLDIHPEPVGQSSTLQHCACGAPATSGSDHNECGRCYRNRLRSISIDGPRTTNYYDAGGVDDVFGPDSKDRLMEGTEGRGHARTDDKGEVWSRNPTTSEIERVDEKTFDRVYAGAKTEREATPEEAAW
jgi:hypothetical protein